MKQMEATAVRRSRIANATTAPPLRDLAEFFGTLADSSRLGMLALLQRHGEMCVCDIQEVLGVTQSRASRHLQALRRSGLVQDRRVGVWVHYRIVDRSGPRQLLVLKALPQLLDPAAVADVDRKLATWRRRKHNDPCPVPRAPGRSRKRKGAGR